MLKVFQRIPRSDPRFQSTFPVFESSVCRRPRVAIFLGSRRSPPWFLQEECCAPHVTSLLHAWVCAQCNLLHSPDLLPSSQGARVPDPSPSASQVQPGDVPQRSERSSSSDCFVFQKFPWRSHHLHSALLLRSCRSHVMGRRPPQQQAHVRLPSRSPFQSGSPVVEARSVPTGSGGVTLEAGPVRLTRFVEMSLEHHYSTVNAMVNEGRFEHIGRATIRVEGASAWWVWLRVDHWPSVLGRHPAVLALGQT